MSYSKLEVLTDIFDVENIYAKLAAYHKIKPELLLEVLAKNEYNLKEELGVTASSITKMIGRVWPEKPKTTLKLCTYLLEKYGFKNCPKCNTTKEIDCFYKNSRRPSGLCDYCKPCQALAEAPCAPAKNARYRASKLKRTPSWLTDKDYEEVAEFYKKCPAGHHIDHILPLQGEYVSGFHVLSNLQYLSSTENTSKGNRYTPL